MRRPTVIVFSSDARLSARYTWRPLESAAESCLDIGQRIIAQKGFRTPEDNKDVFTVLSEESVLPEELLPDLIQMAQFRNLIVRDYARIDDLVVHSILKERLGDFDQYALAIVAYLEKL